MPDTTGPPEFNRVFRAHQNTLEQLPSFLSSLWMCSAFVSAFPYNFVPLADSNQTHITDAKIAAGLGAAWVLTRIGYARAYRNAEHVGRWTIPGYMIVNTLTLLTFGRVIRSFF